MRATDTFENVIGKVHRMSQDHYDESISIRDMEFDSFNNLTIAGDGFEVLPSAQRLIANRLRIPQSYLSRCPEDLQSDNLNYWLEREQKNRETFFCRFSGNKLRGVFTERYTALDHMEILTKMLDYGFDPACEVHYSLDESLMVLKVPEYGRMFGLTEKDKIVPGISIANSEVGILALSIEAFFYRLVCSNGLNPVHEIEFIPEDEIIKYIPSSEDIDKVISAADSDTQDYLLTIRDTLGRMGEINHLTWDDINFKGKYVILYTRKKKGGNLKPRKVPMTNNLYEILWRRYQNRDKRKLWVFWHTYTSSKTGKKVDGPYKDRKKIMRTLCKNAGVKYFRFHPLRHSGASIMDSRNVPIGSIQKVLGHEHRSTTEIYLHSIGSAVRDAISVFEQAVKKSHTDSHTEQKKD